MRTEPYAVGSYLHVVKRGARGLPITRDLSDQWRFVRLLYYLNDEYKNEIWERDAAYGSLFERPSDWPRKKPLVRIVAWTLMPNHFHLILQEIREGGVSKFMQKLCNSMTTHFNLKYAESGSLFQGSYKSRTIDSDAYLRYVLAYVMVKNVFEMYPEGYDAAVADFDTAWGWALSKYKFTSLKDYVSREESPILSSAHVWSDFFDSKEHFKSCAKEMVIGHLYKENLELAKLLDV